MAGVTRYSVYVYNSGIPIDKRLERQHGISYLQTSPGKIRIR